MAGSQNNTSPMQKEDRGLKCGCAQRMRNEYVHKTTMLSYMRSACRVAAARSRDWRQRLTVYAALGPVPH